MNKKDTKSNLFSLPLLVFTILYIASFSVINAQIGVYPYPNVGTATIDGVVGAAEWDLNVGSADWFAHMYEGFNNNGKNRILSNVYLKYDCDTEMMYVLVYQATWENVLIPLVNSRTDAWVAIDGIGNKVVKQDPLPANTFFAWVDENYAGAATNTARGYEASFPLTKNATYDIIVHTNVHYDGGTATSGTGADVQVNVDCGVLPVEMTSFSINIENNIAELLWETATEVNNYGFEVQRTAETDNWEKIGFVNGHGNSNSPKFYSYQDAEVDASGKYLYRLKQIDIDGTFEYSDVVEIDYSTPGEYKLNQNYPNPFNPSTTISYSIPEQSEVKIIVYNIFGEEVRNLVNDRKEAGTYSINFNAENLASGIYFYSIETDKFVQTKKLTLIK